jgi:hypothetical protein
MEYIQGELLSNVFKRTKLGVEDTIYLGQNMLRGVAEMHTHGIIHRDLKPANVMLRPIQNGWRAVILDFNLSRFKDGKDESGKPQGALTTMGSAIGTIPFMAPEQIVDARRANEAADVYAVAAILFNAVARSSCVRHVVVPAEAHGRGRPRAHGPHRRDRHGLHGGDRQGPHAKASGALRHRPRDARRPRPDPAHAADEPAQPLTPPRFGACGPSVMTADLASRAR